MDRSANRLAPSLSPVGLALITTLLGCSLASAQAGGSGAPAVGRRPSGRPAPAAAPAAVSPPRPSLPQNVAPAPVVATAPAAQAAAAEAPALPLDAQAIPRLHLRLRLHSSGLVLGQGLGVYASIGFGLRFGVEMPNGWSFDWETVGAFGGDPPSSTDPLDASFYDENAQPLYAVIQLQTGPVVRRQFRLVYVDLGVTIDNLWVLADILAQMKLGGGVRAGIGVTTLGRAHPLSVGLGLVGERVSGFAVVSVGIVSEARF